MGGLGIGVGKGGKEGGGGMAIESERWAAILIFHKGRWLIQNAGVVAGRHSGGRCPARLRIRGRRVVDGDGWEQLAMSQRRAGGPGLLPTPLFQLRPQARVADPQAQLGLDATYDLDLSSLFTFMPSVSFKGVDLGGHLNGLNNCLSCLSSTALASPCGQSWKPITNGDEVTLSPISVNTPADTAIDVYSIRGIGTTNGAGTRHSNAVPLFIGWSHSAHSNPKLWFRKIPISAWSSINSDDPGPNGFAYASIDFIMPAA
ncbi:hypothetical protein BC826DRAFT_973286 [Russula brevipes]|nr:hypothetical protein BC826DRAFT_973286 [Russula brevipes]